MLPTTEDAKTEFKQSFSDDVIIALVAFANSKGGKVYVGMRDNGTVCGVSLGKEALQTWLNEIKQKTEPSIIPDLEVIDVDGKQVVMLTVQEYPVKPVSTKGRYYVRQANSNHLMSAFEISNSILQTKNSSWDYYPCIGKTLSDIDIEKVKKVMRVIAKRNDRFNITDPMEFLRKYEFIDDQNRISNGCYLMFCKDINILTTIQMGHFASEIVIKDDYIVDSDIIEQVDEVMQFIRKHINKALIIVD
ncbi:MAG: putative DNA binding domain-containing protein, partial [Bacteroidales bacterium]|nr:putative DNA binding domain-containing protein [Bacteroidales bacterium]